MPRLNQARIVIAGDPTHSKKLAATLIKAGHPVREAGTPDECRRIVDSEVPDVVVIHCLPAESGGLELCRQLRQNPCSAGAAILLISAAFSKSAERVVGLEAGADGCLAEPVEAAELLAQVDCLARLRQVETKLRESEERFRLATEAINGLIYDWNVPADLTRRSAGMAEFLGWRAEEVPEDSRWWPEQIHPDDTARVLQRFHDAVAHQVPACSHEYRVRHKLGHYLWIWDSNRIVYDAQGRVARVIGCVVSIEEQKRADQALHRAKEELARANQDLERKVEERTAKLQETVAELESWSYSIAHDMRAPLRTMHGYSKLLAEEHGPKLEPAARYYLQRIDAATQRLDQYIRDLLDYGKVVRGELPLDSVDAAALLGEIVTTYPDFQPARCDIQVIGGLPPVQANAAALTQVISNLLDNAVKFAKPGAFPRVRVRGEEIDGRVRLWFEDEGIGIDDRSHKRIFGIFQSLHPHGQYEGTGIGLAIVRRAVERMGGKVGVQSEPDRGSRFWVELQKGTQEPHLQDAFQDS
jgi:PAS domain S-box-containing protein